MTDRRQFQPAPPEPPNPFDVVAVLGMLAFLLGVALFLFTGACSKPPPSAEPPLRESPALRRATALELLEASTGTNEPPAWFNAQERAAVLKLRAP